MFFEIWMFLSIWRRLLKVISKHIYGQFDEGFPELRHFKTATLQKQTKLRNCLPRGQRTLDFICPVFQQKFLGAAAEGLNFLSQ